MPSPILIWESNPKGKGLVLKTSSNRKRRGVSRSPSPANKRRINMIFKKKYLKKSSEELQEYLKFKKRGFAIPPKKGKGSFKRNKKIENINY